MTGGQSLKQTWRKQSQTDYNVRACKSKDSPEAVLPSQGFAVKAWFRMFSSSKKLSFFDAFFEMVRSLARIEFAWKCVVVRNRIILPLV